jgi:hypothetical protein
MNNYYGNPVGILVAFAMISGCVSAPEVVEPNCSNPAPLAGKFDRRAPGYIAMFVDGVTNAEAMTRELAREHGFTPESTFRTIKGFSVQVLTPTALAGLRCEPTIKGISFNERTQIAGSAL